MVEPQKKGGGVAVCLHATPPCLLLLIGQLAVTPDLLNIPEPWLEPLWRRTRSSQWRFVWKEDSVAETSLRGKAQEPSPLLPRSRLLGAVGAAG